MKLILFLVVFGGIWQEANTQVNLNVVWKKNIYPTEIKFAKFSSDGNYIYCATGTTIDKMDAKTGEFVSRFENTGVNNINDMDISSLGNYIVTHDGSGNINIWDTRLEKAIKFKSYVSKPGYDGALAVAIAPDEKYILAYVKVASDGLNYKSFLVAYDFINDKEIFNNQENIGLTEKIAISHDGKYFVTGSYYKDNISKLWHDQLIIWETETRKQRKVLEDIETGSLAGGYKFIKFSLDDKYLGGVRMQPWEVHIYNTITGNRENSSDGRSCVNIEFLPDSLNYIMAYVPAEYYQLGTNKLMSKAERWMGRIESCNFNKTVFVQNSDSVFLYSLKTTSITENNIYNDQFIISISEGKVIFTNISNISNDFLVIITDLLGKLIYTEKIDNLHPNNSIVISPQFPSTVYICKVIVGNKEFTQKLEILR